MAASTQNTAKRAHSVKRDVLIIAAILAVTLLAWGGIKWYGSTHAGAATVKITDGDGAITYLPLNDDARSVVTTELGTNTIVVENGGVHIEDADCRNHDCMDQGTIDSAGQTLICLPHKLYVEIVDESPAGGDNELDGMTR